MLFRVLYYCKLNIFGFWTAVLNLRWPLLSILRHSSERTTHQILVKSSLRSTNSPTVRDLTSLHDNRPARYVFAYHSNKCKQSEALKMATQRERDAADYLKKHRIMELMDNLTSMLFFHRPG